MVHIIIMLVTLNCVAPEERGFKRNFDKDIPRTTGTKVKKKIMHKFFFVRGNVYINLRRSRDGTRMFVS